MNNHSVKRGNSPEKLVFTMTTISPCPHVQIHVDSIRLIEISFLAAWQNDEQKRAYGTTATRKTKPDWEWYDVMRWLNRSIGMQDRLQGREVQDIVALRVERQQRPGLRGSRFGIGLEGMIFIRRFRCPGKQRRFPRASFGPCYLCRPAARHRAARQLWQKRRWLNIWLPGCCCGLKTDKECNVSSPGLIWLKWNWEVDWTNV